MTKTKDKTLNWRLSDLPTAGEVAELVDSEVITKEEAREILFTQASSSDEKVKALEEQVEFLQGLVTTLSQQRNTTTFVPFSRTITTPNIYWASTNKVIGDAGLVLSSTTGSHTSDTTLRVSGGGYNG